MTERRDILDLVRRWIEKAEHDLINAQYTMTMIESCPYDTVCFHAQQCAEKYLKAVLVYRQIGFPKSHDLSELAGLIFDNMPDRIGDECLLLNVYAVSTRYPGFDDPLGYDEAAISLAAAGRIRDATREMLPDEVLV